MTLAVFGSVASTTSCTPASPVRRFSSKRGVKATTMSASSRRNTVSISRAVDSSFTTLKKRFPSRRSAMRVVAASFDGSSTATRLWLISVVMAKPKSMICNTGMPSNISIVRRSRKMWKNSILTKAQNCFIT